MARRKVADFPILPGRAQPCDDCGAPLTQPSDVRIFHGWDTSTLVLGVSCFKKRDEAGEPHLGRNLGWNADKSTDE